MAKILILYNKETFNKANFYSYLRRELAEDIDLEMASFEDIGVMVTQGKVEIMVGEKDLASFDLVYFRKAGKAYSWLAGCLALYLDFRGIKYLDSTYREIGPTGSKLTSLIKLALVNLPVIPTYYCHASAVPLYIFKLGWPLVAKEMYSQRGNGVSLVKNMEDLIKLLYDHPLNSYMFQKYLATKEEYRVLVLGQDIGAFERKTPTVTGEFRSNVALGASEEFLAIAKIPANLKAISLQAAKTLGIEVAGVDILIDSLGNPWLLEVNRGPGFTYDDPSSPEMANLAAYFKTCLKK